MPPPIELPEFEVRDYRPGDEHGILEVFNRVFAEVDPNFEPRTLEQWRWQFTDNPSGHRIKLAVTPEGQVLSQYAAFGQRTRLEGEAALFCHAVDSMTDPRYRKGLKRPGFFVLTGQPWRADFMGPPPDGVTAVWGLPIPPAWRIGKTYLSYKMLRTQQKLVADLERFEAAAAPGVSVRELDAPPPDALDLFERASAPYGAMQLRDEAHLDWRFFRRPGVAYRFAEARSGGELVGYAAWRAVTFDHRRDGCLAEWLVDPGAPDARHALLAWAAERTRAEGLAHLTCVIPDCGPDWLALQDAGLRVRPTMYFLAGHSHGKRHSMQWLHHHWYYTLGDSDLV